MTKDEIIDKTLTNAQKYGSQCVNHDQIRTMMESYAKQQAIAFGEWVDVNAVRNGYHEWTVGCGDSKKKYTSEQLYNQFIESQNNNTDG